METIYTCPHCKKEDIVKRGSFETKAHGKQQRYFCKSCNKKFIVRTGFYRMRNTPQKITLSIDLFYRGVSTRKIQEHLQAFYPHNSSNVSIYNWVVKYSKMISSFTERLKIENGHEVQVDEMEYNRLGQRNWFIDSIDTKTRFMVASNFFDNRGQKALRKVISKARYSTNGNVTTITTDGYLAYPKIIKKVFGYNNRLGKHNVTHNKVNASKGEGFNIYIERMHNSIRERTKTFRGFHGSVESADAIMKGYSIFYNFVRKHQSLGCTPSQIAIPQLNLGINRWLSLIEMTTQNIKSEGY
jgi:transposase-like protein